MSNYKSEFNRIIINIRVIPNSSKNELLKDGDRIRLKITAPPVDNKANKFIISYFSKNLKIPKSSIQIIKGELSRDKTILFEIDDSVKFSQIEDFFNLL